MKRKTIIASLLSLILALGLIVLFLVLNQTKASQGSDSIKDGYYLLTIDGYGVTEEEFRLFLNDQKAITANHFWVEYQAQPDNAFWNTSFDGQTPNDYAKQRALSALITSKIEFILAHEYEILDYKNYDELIVGMEAENADRAQKAETGDVFYGLTQFSPFTYYQYLNGNIRSELITAQEKIASPSTADLRKVYDENLETFSLGIVYKFQVNYPNGSSELVAQSSLEVAKEDSTTELLLAQFETMSAGDEIDWFDYHGQYAQIVFLGAEAQGYLSFEEAADSLKALYARSATTALIQSRADAAKVEIDQVRFDAIKIQ